MKPSLCAKPSVHWAPKPRDHGPLHANKLLLDEKGVGDRVPKNMLMLWGWWGHRTSTLHCPSILVPPQYAANTPVYLPQGPHFRSWAPHPQPSCCQATPTSHLVYRHGSSPRLTQVCRKPRVPPAAPPAPRPLHAEAKLLPAPPCDTGKTSAAPVATLTEDEAQRPTAPCSARVTHEA